LYVVCVVVERQEKKQSNKHSSSICIGEWITHIAANQLNLRKKSGLDGHWIIVVVPVFVAVSFYIFKIADALEMRLRGSIGFLIISLIFMSGNMLNSSSTASRADRKSTLISGFITLSFE